MNRKLSSLAVAAVLAGCGGGMDVQGYGSSTQVNAAMLTAAREWDHEARTDTELERLDARARFLSFLNELRDLPQLAPLWDRYGISNPVTTEDDDRCGGLITLLREVRITKRDGTVRITNRATGGVIFTAPRSNLAAGTFDAANLPGGSPPPAGACTAFTYSAWSACGAGGTQTRTVVSASPAGCTGGAPVTAQACTPALDGAALYGASCAGCHGALAGSNLRGVGISLSLIDQKNMRQGLTDAQLQAIVTAVGP